MKNVRLKSVRQHSHHVMKKMILRENTHQCAVLNSDGQSMDARHLQFENWKQSYY
jgi:hypothetical protein